jgi:DNA invertase Pin-like site-specific DNA recombinase
VSSFFHYLVISSDNHKESVMVKRAVLYVRVSRDDTVNDSRNLQGQLDMCREHAQKEGWQIVAELAEDSRGASGADIHLPKLTSMRKMARDHAFDVLVVREMDRLSRNLAKQLIVEEELKTQGIEIAYVLGQYPDTPDGNLMRNFRASLAEYEREKINERVVRGRYSKIKAGSVLVAGYSPYGYQLVRQNNHFGLEIDESEAAVVRMIFEWYLSGLSVRKITKRLTEMGIPTYSDNRSTYAAVIGVNRKRAENVWSAGSVRHIILNETYAVALQNSVKSFKRAAPREQLANGPDMIGQICGHGRGGLER